MSRKLTLADIADVRAYERERDAFRTHVIDLKRRRRVHVGTIMTFLFENRDTIRFQIQEMARVEKLTTDDEIRIELDIYNPMIPDPGQVCATMFLELTTDEQPMRELEIPPETNMFVDFVRELRGGEPSRISQEEAFRSCEISLLARKACEEGVEVKIP